MNNNNMDMTNNEIFGLGMEVGRKQLADHIQHQFEIGKPAEINGKLYWMKDAKQNLMDIMDDIESAWNDEHGVKKFIVPISITYNTHRTDREVIIETVDAKTAMLIAIGDFQRDGSLIKGFLTYKTVTKGIDIFNFFKGKSDSKRAMDAFFQSALNGTMQVKDGFLQIGEAERQIFNNRTSSGFGKQVLLLAS